MTVKILLTGATGFIGTAFTSEALSRGHEILAILRPGKRVEKERISAPGITYVSGTLENPPWPAINNFRPQTCVHAAWISTPGIYLEATENRELVKWSREFLTEALRLGVEHAIVLGTCIEYAPSNRILSEEAPLGPHSLYAQSKVQLHEELERNLVPKGLNLAWARLFYPYGIGEHPQRLCSSMIAKLRQGQEVRLKTPNSIKDYIYITDVASALTALVETDYSGTVNIGTGEGSSIYHLASLIAAKLERAELLKLELPEEPDAYPHVVADVRRLASLGWKRRISLEEGVRLLLKEKHFS